MQFRRPLCRLGRQSWERRLNPEIGGASAVSFVCSRCGKDKASYDPPTPGQAAGMAAGG
jgi:hypothetical protein